MRKGLTIAGLSLLFIQGCSTYSVPRYSANAETVERLRASAPAAAKVGPFTTTGESRSEITCRGGGPIKPTDGESFADYARKALASELRLAGVYSDQAPVTLSGNVDRLDFSSTEGRWDIAMTVASTNGAKVSKSVTYQYPTNFVGEIACNATAQAFVPAMQDLISAVVADSTFPQLLKPAP